MNADVRYPTPPAPRGGLVPLALACLLPLAALLSGCGKPEAEFSTSQAAEDLIPEARREVVRVVEENFGEPDRLVAWMRLPLAFGGVAGTVVGSEETPAGLVKVLHVQFAAPAVLVRYDHDLDGYLSLAELPTELEKAMAEKRGAKTTFERADADGDGRLSAAEIAKAKVDSEDFVAEIINPFTGQPPTGTADGTDAAGETTPDGPAADEAASDDAQSDDAMSEPDVRRIYFTEGTYVDGETGLGQDMAVESFNPLTGRVELAGALAEPPRPGERVIVDFGSRLQTGRKHYMHHCMHCHGVTGDGHGPTAEYLNPRPRDYRLGIFKFTSTPNKEPPTREDLHRTITQGIPGTYMPSFALLEPEVVDAIAEYVRWLSMRGVLEKELIEELGINGLKFSLTDIDAEAESLEILYRGQVKSWEEGGHKGNQPEPPPSRAEIRQQRLAALQEFQKEDLAGLVDETGDDIAKDWRQSELLASVILPDEPRTPSTPESRARGRLVFLGNDCQNCHGVTGEGNGPLTREFSKNTTTDKQNPTPGLYDDWGHPVQPRNLHSGIYRGGRRPLDLYRRIHSGISGTPMPTFGSKLKPAQIWDLVNYVLSIPYEEMATRPAQAVADEPGADEPGKEPAETAALAAPAAATR